MSILQLTVSISTYKVHHQILHFKLHPEFKTCKLGSRYSDINNNYETTGHVSVTEDWCTDGISEIYAITQV